MPSVDEISRLFSSVDIFSMDKLLELKMRLGNMKVHPHVIALQEVKPKNFRSERVLREYSKEGLDTLEKRVASIYQENCTFQCCTTHEKVL